MNKEITREEQRAIAWLLAISVAIASAGTLIIALSAAGVLGYTPQPVSDPVEPDPWIVGNVTKDSHESSWGLTEYEDDYGDPQTLPGFVADTAAVNYSRIHGFQSYDVGTKNWSDPDHWAAEACDLNNIVVATTANGISFYGEPHGAGQTSCSFRLYPSTIGVTSGMRWTVGFYVHGITAPQQRIGLWLDGSYIRKEYVVNTDKEGPFPWESTGGNVDVTYLSNASGTTIFWTQMINEIGEDGEENQMSEVETATVHLASEFAGSNEPIKVELFFFQIAESPLYIVGYDPTGDKVYVQHQADEGSVKLGLFSPTFDYVSIDNLKVGYKQHASDLSDADVEVQRGQYLSTYRFSYPQPEAISLHYEDVVLRDKLNQPGNVFSDVQLNGQDIKARYAPLSKGAEIVLLEGILEGEQPMIYFKNSYSADEWDDIVTDGGGLWDFGGGFITPQLVAPFVALGILVAILAVVLIQKFKKSREEREAGEEKPSVRGLAKDEKAILMEGREILHWLVIGAIVLFIIFTIIAMVLSIPIIWPAWIGVAGVLPLSWGVYSTWNNEGLASGIQLDFVSDTMDAFVQGLINIFNAVVNAIVSVINVIGTVIGTFIELIVLPPARFVGGSFDAATATLEGLGISAPLAMIIVTVSVGVVIATVGVFVYRQLTAWED